MAENQEKSNISPTAHCEQFVIDEFPLNISTLNTVDFKITSKKQSFLAENWLKWMKIMKNLISRKIFIAESL